MKKISFVLVMILGLLVVTPGYAIVTGFTWFHPWVLDIGSSISRMLSVAMKLFLGNDQEITAQLVYDGGEETGAPAGGNGGAYTGDNGSAGLSLQALTSPLTDIPAEKGAYPADIKIQQTSIAELAKYRIQSVVKEQASLDQLSADKWAIQYRAQQRAIQAMTDALVMKSAYKDLASIAEMASSGSYANYSEAASTVATRRLLLDELMALRKRVIAARIRARAETMEMEIDTLATAPTMETTDTPATSTGTGGGTTTVYEDKNVPSEYDDTGLVQANTEEE